MTGHSAMDRLHALATEHGLHLVLAPHGEQGRWRIGVVRPLADVHDGVRSLRSYAGVGPVLEPHLVEGAAGRLADALAASLLKAPPSRGT